MNETEGRAKENGLRSRSQNAKKKKKKLQQKTESFKKKKLCN